MEVQGRATKKGNTKMIDNITTISDLIDSLIARLEPTMDELKQLKKRVDEHPSCETGARYTDALERTKKKVLDELTNIWGRWDEQFSRDVSAREFASELKERIEESDMGKFWYKMPGKELPGGGKPKINSATKIVHK